MSRVARDMRLSATADGGSTDSTVSVLRRGFATSPELRRGAVWTVLAALVGGAGRVAVPVLVQQVLDRGLTDDGVQLGTVYRLAGLAVVVVVGTALANALTRRRLASSSETALANLRARAFAHIHDLSLATLTGERRGVLVARVTSDVEALSRFLSWGGIAWLVNTALITTTVATMLAYDWRLALVTMVMVAPVPILLSRMQKRLAAAYDAVRERVGDMLGAISESIQGAAVLRAYGVVGRDRDRVVGAIEHHRKASTKAGVLASLLFPMGEIAAGLTVAAVVVAALAIGPGGGLSAGEVVAFLFLVRLFLEPVAEFTEILDQTQLAVAGWRKVLDVLDMPLEITAPAEGVLLPGGPPEIVVDRVGYAYPGDPPVPVLAEVSFRIPPGCRVALVGATGSGKTTLAKLLTRLADPTEGRILVSGVDLRDVTPASLRTRLVMVPQDGFLFDTTVLENVRFGTPDATEDEVRAAFVDLGLGPWLAGLPGGLHTEVGQRGDSLSVGERQLVSLVRASIADPSCLILDEATSNVDPATDAALTRALARLTAGRTSVTIAHRLATAEQADLVVVLDGGRLVELGTSDDLLARDGVYAGLHASWLDVTATSAATAAR